MTPQDKNNILIFGSTGMLGSELMKFLKNNVQSFVYGIPRNELNIMDEFGVINKPLIRNAIRNRVAYDEIGTIVNCAALTDTTGIEKDPDTRAKSFALNAMFPKVLAEICEEFGLRLVHVSTDYVFSEYSCGTENRERPITYYGDHKLMAELYIKNAMPSGKYTILRVGWIYGVNREKSFVHKFLRNCIDATLSGKRSVQVVDNQVSTPTSCLFVSVILHRLIETEKIGYGTFSTAPLGSASRYDFAVEILKNVDELGDWFRGMKVERLHLESIHPKYTVLFHNDPNGFFDASQGGHSYEWKEDLRSFFSIYGYEIKEFVEKTFNYQRKTFETRDDKCDSASTPA